MHYAKTIIKNYRCDEAMKQSKEKCNTPFNTEWRCTGKCQNCICCIEKDAYGQERHRGTSEDNNKRQANYKEEQLADSSEQSDWEAVSDSEQTV